MISKLQETKKKQVYIRTYIASMIRFYRDITTIDSKYFLKGDDYYCSKNVARLEVYRDVAKSLQIQAELSCKYD